MRVPYSWLKEYLPQAPPAEELAEVLTLGGLEVEEIENWAAEDGGAQDQVLLTSVTANRGDLLSMVGVARHAAALLGIDFAPSTFNEEFIATPTGDSRQATSGEVTVELVDPEGGPRYSGLLLQGLQVAPSPDGLRYRLEAAGIRAINNVVDATNYLCWELGQPMHAFDFRFLQDGHIIVRRARPGEEVMLIDESVPFLTEEDVVIADPIGAVALAGVMGGLDSQMRDSTTTVLLEAAHFDPTSIRKTSLRLGISTESSYRFERHVDPNLTLPALARAAELILEFAGGEVAGPAVDVQDREFAPWDLTLRPERCNAVLGTNLGPEQMAEYLRRLGFSVAEGDKLTVTVPTFRRDVEREVDLIEEVAIVHGYDNIPLTIPGRLHRSGRLTKEQQIEARARELLRQCGLNETLSFSQMSPQDLDKLGWPSEAQERRFVRLSNPLSAEQTVMRTTLLPAMLQACAYNQRQRVPYVALYEINPVFFAREEGELPEEHRRLAVILVGSPFTATWNLAAEITTPDFYRMKSLVEQFISGLGLEDLRFARGEHPVFATAACAEVFQGEQSLGWLGEIAGPALEAYELEGPVFAGELDFEAIVAAATPHKQYCPLPRFPAAFRDVAVALPDTDEFNAAAVAVQLREVAGEHLESVQPFDLYVDPERLGAQRKSLAFELVFRAPDRTLTDQEVEAAMERVHARLEQIGGQVRKQ